MIRSSSNTPICRDKGQNYIPVVFFILLLFCFQPVLISSVSAADKKLKIILAFHFNQNMVPYQLVACETAYTGLLKTLEKHEKIKAVLHLSGPTMQSLQWFEPAFIDDIKEGIKRGKYELFGSAFSQSVLYLLPENQNRYQLETYRKTIKEIFNREVKGYWNPERGWSGKFIPLLNAFGYEYSFLENKSQKKFINAMLIEKPKRLHYLDSSLLMFTDDIDLRNAVNSVLYGSDPQVVLDYLKKIFLKDKKNEFVIAYAEDAEAFGEWQYNRNWQDPRKSWKNFDKMLSVIEDCDWIETVLPSELIARNLACEDVYSFEDTQGDWMAGFSKVSGYRDWFDFIDKYPPIKYYQALYQDISDKIKGMEDKMSGLSESETTSKLLYHAKYNLVSHQFQFGSNKNVFTGMEAWEGARKAYYPLKALEYVFTAKQEEGLMDIDKDGEKEVILANEKNFIVLSENAGIIKYWFDLEKGDEIIGQEDFTYYGELYNNETRYIPRLEAFKYPLWEWLSDHDKLYPTEILRGKVFSIRRKALYDFMEIDGDSFGDISGVKYDFKKENGILSFGMDYGRLFMEKKYTLINNELKVEYIFKKNTGRKIKLTDKIVSGFCPAYMDIKNKGEVSVDYYLEGVINRNTGLYIGFEYKTKPDKTEYADNIFGRELSNTYEMEIKPGQSKEIKFNIVKKQVEKINPKNVVYEQKTKQALLRSEKKAGVMSSLIEEYIIEDEKSDDTGYGPVIYPLSGHYSKGMFDIVSFDIRKYTDKLEFVIRMNKKFENPRKGKKGFTYQAYDIYINTGGGIIKAALKNRNIQLTEGWDMAISFNAERLELQNRDGRRFFDSEGIKYRAEKESIILEIPVYILESFGYAEEIADWKYQVISMNRAMDFYENASDITEIKKNPTEFEFGGGLDENIEPNVIDILNSSGIRQEEILSKFNQNTIAECPMIKAEQKK